MLVKVLIVSEPFSAQEYVDELASESNQIGAIVSFTGHCRKDNQITALELEHYPQMAENQIKNIAETATARWKLLGATIVHRVGKIDVGETIVLVATAASHRHAAFNSADFIMDFLKSEAPFWKKEHSTIEGEGSWVDARESDEVSLKRWRENN